MKKKTISAILTAIIICLLIAIIILCVKISLRGPKTAEDLVSSEEELTVSTDKTLSEDSIEEEEELYVAKKELVAIPNTTSSVNVRSGPGTDYQRIGSAYSDCEYVVLEILDSGWTKLNYDGQEGYISSEFLSYKTRQDLGDGTYSYDEVTEDISNYKAE